MNLENLTDQNLLKAMDQIATDEREKLVTALFHLREIERRRLFCDLKFRSLFDYAVKHLKYSGDQAVRRISAMRLLKETPEVAAKLQTGVICLTNAAVAQNFFRRSKMPLDQRREFLLKIENKSTREVEFEIAKIAPRPIKKDSVRPVTEDVVHFSFTGPRSLEEKLRRLQGLKGHQNLSLAELIEKTTDLGLKEWNPAKPSKRMKRESLGAPMSQSAISREVWRRDESKCVNCGSTYAVQEDHIIPRALGGQTTLENLRLLCRPCNQRAALVKLGAKTMAPFLDAKIRPVE